MFEDPKMKAYIGQLARAVNGLTQQLKEARAEIEMLKASARPLTVQEEIDKIPGRRVWYNYVGSVNFTATQRGTRGEPIIIESISQDGPFIQTAYPLVVWKPVTPDGGAAPTNLGRWRPVYSWPLPTQELGGDIIDISWEVQDGGPNRDFQNAPVPPIFTRSDVVQPLPVPVLWTPNSSIKFTPTYEAINFDDTVDEATTEGVLRVVMPGYKICNM
jgi:hypothetical protein